MKSNTFGSMKFPQSRPRTVVLFASVLFLLALLPKSTCSFTTNRAAHTTVTAFKPSALASESSNKIRIRPGLGPVGSSGDSALKMMAGLGDQSSMLLAGLRGGGEVTCAITSAIQAGPYGIPALFGVASAVVVPLTLFRQAYSFSVGYGYSIMAMGIAMLLAFPAVVPSSLSAVPDASPAFFLASSAVFYGIRLGSFLLLRNATVKSKADQLKSFDKTPRLKRIPLALSVSLFYAFLASPAMYALRGSGEGIGMAIDTLAGKVSVAGVVTAWFGAILEAVADGQKFWKKRGATSEETFVGPTGGSYRICRHPNYLGEIVYWIGLALGGAPAFGKNAVPWLCSALGLFGIVSIMTNATKRLDDKQKEKYEGQEKYDSWRKEVSPLIPLVSE